MKVNKWTLGLAAVGLVSLPAASQAEEQLSPVQTALQSTTISGYVNTAAQWDFGTGNFGAPAYSYNGNKQDGFSLNAVKLTIERPLDEAQWAAGYKVDLMFGPDADAFGSTWNSFDTSGPNNALGTGNNAVDNAYADHTHSGSDMDNFAVRQAYVNLRAPVGNGLDFKVGVFDTIVGYESTDAGSNPNYTRSWGYTIEPLSHTGVLASYQANDMFGFSAGVANTVGPAINSRARTESYKTYMGSVAFTAPESFGFLAGSTLYGGIVNGFNNSLDNNQTHYYVGGTLATPVEGLRFGAAYDYDDVHNAAGSQDYAWAVAGYLTYQFTEKLSVHGRGEYMARGSEAMTGFPGKVVGTTATLQYDLWKNVLTRLEFRWDHQADGKGRVFGGTDATNGKRNALMLAFNAIYKF